MSSESQSESNVETGLTHECGVFGCVAAGPWPSELEVSDIISLGLVGLQHRGQECAGIATGSGNVEETFNVHKGMGLISSIFNPNNLAQLKGNLGIGHNRYSTHGKSELLNCQPFVVDTLHGQIAVAHNGELVNKKKLREEILGRGVGLSSSSDSEVITQILCFPPKESEENGPNWLARIRHLLERTPMAYSLLVMNGSELYAVRDTFGNRPLCLGKLVCSTDDKPKIDGWVVSSESCVFQSLGAVLHRELYPGEILKLSSNGPETLDVVPRPSGGSSALCIFEYVYFARPDSVMQGQTVYNARYRCGVQLAIEAPADADVVSSVPESATPAAFGYANEIGLPFVEVLAKNRYIGRTFIQPSKRLRQLAVAKKFGPLRKNIEGKRVILIDDSIVRGNTMGPIIMMLRKGGAKEVHVRIASPPIKHPCYMGINIPSPHELVANKLNIEEITNFIGADSLNYLSLDGLLESVKSGIPREQQECNNSTKEDIDTASGQMAQKNLKNGRNCGENGHCVACLSGNYPVTMDW